MAAEKDKSKVHKLSLKGELDQNPPPRLIRSDFANSGTGSSKLVAEFVSIVCLRMEMGVAYK